MTTKTQLFDALLKRFELEIIDSNTLIYNFYDNDYGEYIEIKHTGHSWVLTPELLKDDYQNTNVREYPLNMDHNLDNLVWDFYTILSGTVKYLGREEW